MKSAPHVFHALSVLQANYVSKGSRSKISRCIELNFRAAALQSSDFCRLFDTVVDGGDPLASDMTEIDATCGFQLEDVHRYACVEEVVDVVAVMKEEGCDVTGGTTVANFINTVTDNYEGFNSLTQLACKRGGGCYADVLNAIEYCKTNPTDDDCMDYAICECLLDLLPVTQTLSDFIWLDSEIKDKIEWAGLTCRCRDLNSRASSLEHGSSCALPRKIVNDKDIFAGDFDLVADTCNGNNGTSCVDDVVDLFQEFVEYECVVTYSDSDFIFTLKDRSIDFKKITDFSCNNGCYQDLRICQDDYSCGRSLSCDCVYHILEFVDDLSADSQADLLGAYSSTSWEVNRKAGKCKCNELNANAAMFQNEGHCALHNSIVKVGHIFAGDTNSVQSTCAERYACVQNVTEIMAQIGDEGCDIRQDTDFSVKFLYYLNNNSDWSQIIDFLCNSYEAGDGCKDEIQAVAKNCKNDTMENCTEAARRDCLVLFSDMVDRLSDDYLLGIDSVTLRRMEPANLSLPRTQTEESTMGPQSSGAAFHAVPMMINFASLAVYFCRLQ